MRFLELRNEGLTSPGAQDSCQGLLQKDLEDAQLLKMACIRGCVHRCRFKVKGGKQCRLCRDLGLGGGLSAR